jgi:hypothetical protein
MALSKARQAKQWWEEIGGRGEANHISREPSWLKQRLAKLPRKNYRVDEKGAELAQDELISVAVKLYLTGHAKCRLAQRNLSPEEIGFVLLYGQSWHKAGAIITHLRRKDIPSSGQVDPRWRQLIGVTVITPTRSERIILTAYRNRRSGLRNIKHKPDYNW